MLSALGHIYFFARYAALSDLGWLFHDEHFRLATSCWLFHAEYIILSASG